VTERPGELVRIEMSDFVDQMANEMRKCELMPVKLFLTAVLAELSRQRPVAVWADVDDRRLAWVESCVHENRRNIHRVHGSTKERNVRDPHIKLSRVLALEVFRPRLLFSNNFLCSAI
jgi:hypothetical protein